MKMLQFTIAIPFEQLTAALKVINEAPVEYDVNRDTDIQRMDRVPGFSISVVASIGQDIAQVYSDVCKAVGGG